MFQADESSIPPEKASPGETDPNAQSEGPDTNPENSAPDSPSTEPLAVQANSVAFWRRNPVTTVFALVLVLIYAATSWPVDFQAPVDAAVEWLGFYPPLVQAGQWWRFLTAGLLHGNPAHLFNNVVGILIFGNLLESVIGSGRLVVLYALSAFLGLVFSYIMLPKGLTYGASTIDYGLIGCYLGLILLIRFQRDRTVFWGELRSAIVFVVIFMLWNTFESMQVNIWGHLGGFVAGVLFAGWLLLKRAVQAAK